jgi:hypothetical protein
MMRDFKISFYLNSHVNKLFGKRKNVGWFITVGVVVRKGDVRETAVKENDVNRWSFDGVLLWLGEAKW